MMQAEDKIVHVQEKGDIVCHGNIIISPHSPTGPNIQSNAFLSFYVCHVVVVITVSLLAFTQYSMIVLVSRRRLHRILLHRASFAQPSVNAT